jgi:hypothetical protein
MCRVTPETLVWFALLVPVELADALLLAETPLAEMLLAEDGAEDEDEHAAAVRVARLTAAATATVRRVGLTAKRETQFVRFIIVLPY